MLGGEAVARMLKNEGVEKVFGIIDGTYFGFYSSLQKHGIDLISPRHEACAVHMAAAYARVTGKLGVAMASNGPGVANVLPGVAVENGEGNRVLLITSTRRTGIGYPDRGGTYQYFNQIGVTKPMTKWSGAVPSSERMLEFLKRAFRTSWRGRPGVVHVDIPENLLNGKAGYGPFPLPHSYRRTAPIAPDPVQVAEAARLLRHAEAPLIHAGSGVVHAQAFEALRLLAERLQAPVCTSWAARGVLPETHPLAVSMIHVALNHKVRNDADVVLVLGSRVGETDWWGKAPYWRQAGEQKTIQVDVDDDILGLNKPANLCVLADVGRFVEALLDELGTGEVRQRPALKSYHDQRDQHRAKLDKHLGDLKDPMNTAHVPRIAQKFFPDDAIFVIDGGNTAIWGNFFHEARTPGTILGTPKFGMLGAGVAQALGAAVAVPGRAVYCIIGDGAMGFNVQEIETAIRCDLPVIFLVCADSQWGMVKMNQQFTLKPVKTLLFKSLSPEETINTDFAPMRFDKVAEGMGAHGEFVRAVDDLPPALERCRASGKCSVIHVEVDPVKHMWAPSLIDFKKMHEEPKGK